MSRGALSLFALLFVVTASPAVACRCAPPEPDKIASIARDSPQVFAGTVTRIEEAGKRGDATGKYTNRRIAFAVDTGWEGVGFKPQEIIIESEEGPCCMCLGYPFEIGTRYLVIADSHAEHDERPVTVNSSCSPTRSLDPGDPGSIGFQYMKKLGKPLFSSRPAK